jgi:predicted CXXCH cytochrome family protein
MIRAFQRAQAFPPEWIDLFRVASRVAGLLLLSFVILAPDAFGQATPEEIEEADEDCLDCHEDLDTDEREFRFPDGSVRTFDVSRETLRASFHGKRLSCLSCHEGYDEGHQGFPEDSARSYDEARSKLCEGCHEEGRQRHSGRAETPPLCTHCHSAHRDGPISEAVLGISRRCGSCHETVQEAYAAGGHASGLSPEDPNPDLPICTTCHPAHRGPNDPSLKTRIEATSRCIDCHSRDALVRKYGLPNAAAESYRQDFHGMTFQHLWVHPEDQGGPNVMICADCHGNHGVGPLPRSDLYGVCSRCHEDADGALVSAWLGHEPPGPRSGALVWLVRVLYYALIPVVLIGLITNILLHQVYRVRMRRTADRQGVSPSRDGGTDGGASSPLPEKVVRFGRVARVEHVVAMTLFAVLVLTGIPQSYPQSSAGQWLIDRWGGIESTRTIHRVAGFSFAAFGLFHLARAVLVSARRRRLPGMVPRRKDFLDVIRLLKHFLGMGERPKFGRYDYGQKFEYWGHFLGGVLMAVTGLMLIFPEFVSHLLPGVVLAAARVAHGLEATLAVLVILVWHFYEVLFRPEIFPIDTTIFTGKISRARLQHEHPLEYDRLIQEHGEAP